MSAIAWLYLWFAAEQCWRPQPRVVKHALMVVWVPLVALLLLHGCYLEHETAPCDAEVLSGSSTVEHVTVNHGDAGSSPAWTATGRRTPNGTPFCEGPYVGCIAPGSPVSSTWRGE